MSGGDTQHRLISISISHNSLQCNSISFDSAAAKNGSQYESNEKGA